MRPALTVPVAFLGLVLIAVVVGIKALLFPHRLIYVYDFGALETAPAGLWAGPFTSLVIGQPEGYWVRPIADVCVTWPDGKTACLRDLTESVFTTIVGERPGQRYLGHYSYGWSGDIRFGFQRGKLKVLESDYQRGWPCFSKRGEKKTYCLPLSASSAEELFGPPQSTAHASVPWI